MNRINSRIIPIPKCYECLGGEISVDVRIYTEKEEWKGLLKGFCESAEKIFGIGFAEAPGGILLVFDKAVENEAYVIGIDKQVTVSASDIHGAAYGLATVLQLMEADGEKISAPAVKISDKPDKEYRGLMVDLARKWHPFSSVLHYVDLCYFYKIKYLHLHFMDDQSYTLPSEGYPKLPTKNRSYTFEQIEELKEYADNRGVVIVPEVEMPGHARSLNEAYPELFSCKFDEGCGEELVTELGAAINANSIICAGSDVALSGIKKLIDETITLFPNSKYICLGGDEANIKVWENCSVCREYMKKNKLADVSELYCDFTAKVTDYALSKGVIPILWEGFPKKYSDKISKDVIVIGWECHYQNPDSLSESGYRLINCTWQPLYVVPGIRERWGIKEILDWNVYEWQHWWEQSEACLNPIHLPDTEQVMGGQLCVWEQTYEREISFAAENIAALSERLWSVKRYRNYDTFIEKYLYQANKAFNLIAER